MTEQEIREVVRRVVAQRLMKPDEPGALRGAPPLLDVRAHASHGLMRVLPGAEMGGSCVIEPDVLCNRCGYCQSYGH